MKIAAALAVMCALAVASFGVGLFLGNEAGERAMCKRAEQKAFSFLRCVDGAVYSINDPQGRPGLPD